MSENLLLAVLFSAFIIFVVLLAWWSLRDTDRRLRQHNEAIKEMYRRAGFPPHE